MLGAVAHTFDQYQIALRHFFILEKTANGTSLAEYSFALVYVRVDRFDADADMNPTAGERLVRSAQAIFWKKAESSSKIDVMVTYVAPTHLNENGFKRLVSSRELS